MNSNININNKPLKCVITNNESAVKYFSGMPNAKEPYAGTLIVVDKFDDINPNLINTLSINNEEVKYGEIDLDKVDIDDNYLYFKYDSEDKNEYKIINNNVRKIYLNEKFLAGGYGFSSEDLVKKSVYIANNYDSAIDSINNSEINNTVKLHKELQKKLNVDGDASNVYFIYDDSLTEHKLYIADIIELLSKVPQYKDLEIESIKLNATYVDYYGNSNTTSEIVNYENIEEFSLPINVKLNSISGIIRMKTNHSGGVSKIDVYYKNHREDEDFKLARYNVNSYNSDVINCEFTIRLNTNDPYIIGETNKIIDKVVLNNVLETPVSKYQTVQIGSEEKNNIRNIIYTANTIPTHQKEIEFPYIKGEYYLTYSTSTSSSDNNELSVNETNLFGTKQLAKINVNNENKNKFTYINIDKDTTKIILLLPYKFSIRQALLVKDSDEISITNFLNYYNYNGNDNFIQNNLRSCLYYINISNGLKNDYTLKLDIVEDKNVTYEDMNNNNEDNSIINLISFLDATKSYVLNSDEIHKYWVNDYNLSDLNLIFNYDKL